MDEVNAVGMDLYIENGLAYVDFSCQCCGKRYERFLVGNDCIRKCECGATLFTDSQNLGDLFRNRNKRG